MHASFFSFERRFTFVLLAAGLSMSLAMASENGASVYPAGVETAFPGVMPGPGASLFAEFNNFYQANSLVNSKGQSEIPGFHLGVSALAVAFEHNWGMHLLGGTLVSSAAQPYLYETVNLSFGQSSKAGFSNAILEPAALAYDRGVWHWYYGMVVFAPAFGYNKNDLVNIGQHNFAYAPTGAITYLPGHNTEISSRMQYIINRKDTATGYRSGHEFVADYDVMRNVAKKVAIGVNGFFYKQTTNDLQDGISIPGGNRGRDLAIGPQIRFHFGKVPLIAKYTRDTLAQNRAVGNSFWVQFGVPVGHPHE